MEKTDNKINSILRKLNQLDSIDIVPTLLKKGFTSNEANELVNYLEEYELAKFDCSPELRFISTSESSNTVDLKDLFIRAKITIKGKEYLKNHQTFFEELYYRYKIYLFYGLPILLFTYLGSYLWNLDSKTPKIDSLTFTVFVHGPKGLDDLILKNDGKVVLVLKSDKREATINEKGEATFKEIPSVFKGKKVKIFINHQQPYRPIQLDSLYTVNDKSSIHLEVKLYETDSIYGSIFDSKNNKGLDSVRVSIRNISTYSDKFGYYELKIPNKYQKKLQDVRFEKNGYKAIVKGNVPVHTKQGLDILLIKE
ncbi:hypothetical protein CSC80_05105 [Maribacter sp. 6B07]|uniref:carboxypeptidase regulatory-like domain-containing protein n=1 Tax=Maribacter sp. 6B07 TaxID=2045442 RepID=UPI000C06D2C5|nr:carboxypeptidase regulatory-like domain-containing protein [Maribacter sp. 6B07]PHN94727.1 hypothetical protein CSC80_05105 [Maribacter sp. 6B07]